MLIKVVIFLFLFILSILITDKVIAYFKIDNISEPVNKTYASDELSFLKTFYLMENGENYYSAFKSARLNLRGSDILSNDTFLWRSPVVFWFWELFANSGKQILNLFIFLCFLFFLSIFLIIRKITQSWLLGSLGILLLIPYFYDTLAYKNAFLFTEWWGLFFYVFGITFFFYKNNILAVLFLTLSVITRELFFIPVFIIFIYQLFSKKDYTTFLLPLILFLVFILFHRFNISNSINSSVTFNILDRFHLYSIGDLQKMISFSMKHYVFWGQKTHYLFVLLGLVASFMGIFKKGSIYLFLSVIGFLILLPIVSSSDNDYWGIFFVPIIILSIPLMINIPKEIKNL